MYLAPISQMNVRVFGVGILRRKVGPHDTSLGGADAERSVTGVSAWGGLKRMVLKKAVTWPGTSAKTL